MKCLCEEGETTFLKIEGDVSADPIWCDWCMCNLEVEGLSLSSQLESELLEWMSGYGVWFDWEKDQVVPNGIELEAAHNEHGKALTEKVQQEVEGKYKIRFSPATMATAYNS